MVVVGISNVDSAYLQENITQLPFMQSCGRALPLTLYKGKGVRRAIYPLLFYKLGNDGKQHHRRGSVGDDDEDEDEEKDHDDEEEDEEEGKGTEEVGVGLAGWVVWFHPT